MEFLGPLLKGLWVTLQVALGGACLATPLALLGGWARIAPWRGLRWTASVYIEVFRGTSALVQLFWFYFVLPHFGLRLEAMAVGIAVLGLNAGAYGSEVVRGALQSVSRDQKEAADVLNFTPVQRFWRVILPQAVLIAIPSYGNILIELLKSTALVSLITLADLTFVAQTLRASTLETGKIFALVLLLYFSAAYGISLGMRLLEKKAGAGWWTGKTA
jgi:polar amino acid transport system permease protein